MNNYYVIIYVINLLVYVSVVYSSDEYFWVSTALPKLSVYSNANSHNRQRLTIFARGFNKSPSDLVDLGLVNSKNKKEPKIPKYNHGTTQKSLVDWIQNIIGTTTTVASIPEDCPKCSCGTSSIPNRIVGGQDARMHQYPWMTYLTYRGHFYCAASIISDQFLLTAAHCVDRFDKTQIKVHAGGYNRANSSPKLTEYKVQNVIKHSGYSLVNYNNDIALIKINGRIKFEGPMKPVCLPERGSTFTGKNASVTGWGAVEESGALATTLQEVIVPILSNNECRGTKYPPKRITDNMMCAGFLDGGKDSCQGDSGGPLHVLEDKTYKVVGIVSWGEGCAVPGYPGVYSRVNRYITWIERNTKGSCFC